VLSGDDLLALERRRDLLSLERDPQPDRERPPGPHAYTAYTAYAIRQHSIVTCTAGPASRVTLQQIRAAQEAKVDNTGNVCVWPSEEVLAFFCLDNQEAFNNMDVLEVGAGMSGLAGLVIARFASPKTVTITDGNPDCVDLLKHNIEINFPSSAALSSSLVGEETVSDAVPARRALSARLVRWDRHGRYERDSVDVVVGADCLFFEWCHEDLLHLLSSVLRPSGVAFLIAPSRGGSLERFVKLAQAHFRVEVARHFNAHISGVHTSLKERLVRQERRSRESSSPASPAASADASAANSAAFSYDSDLHWPILVKLCRRVPTTAEHGHDDAAISGSNPAQPSDE